jgi:hypothetical protein
MRLLCKKLKDAPSTELQKEYDFTSTDAMQVIYRIFHKDADNAKLGTVIKDTNQQELFNMPKIYHKIDK